MRGGWQTELHCDCARRTTHFLIEEVGRIARQDIHVEVELADKGVRNECVCPLGRARGRSGLPMG